MTRKTDAETMAVLRSMRRAMLAEPEDRRPYFLLRQLYGAKLQIDAVGALMLLELERTDRRPKLKVIDLAKARARRAKRT